MANMPLTHANASAYHKQSGRALPNDTLQLKTVGISWGFRLVGFFSRTTNQPANPNSKPNHPTQPNDTHPRPIIPPTRTVSDSGMCSQRLPWQNLGTLPGRAPAPRHQIGCFCISTWRVDACYKLVVPCGTICQCTAKTTI